MPTPEFYDGLVKSDEIMAQSMRVLAEKITDVDAFPLMASIPKNQLEELQAEYDFLCCFPTELGLNLFKGKLVLISATQGVKPGGRLAVILDVLKTFAGVSEVKLSKTVNRWKKLVD